jgi:hypothetical protein
MKVDNDYSTHDHLVVKKKVKKKSTPSQQTCPGQPELVKPTDSNSNSESVQHGLTIPVSDVGTPRSVAAFSFELYCQKFVATRIQQLRGNTANYRSYVLVKALLQSRPRWKRGGDLI